MKKTAEPLTAPATPSPQQAQPDLKVRPPVEAKSAAATAGFNLDSPELYLNRELTLLDFNRRVLHMSEDELTPLLERLKFLAIVSSNLDEFFMKRIGGLKQQIAAGIRTTTVDGRTPAEQVAECQSVVRNINQQQNRIYRQLLGLLDAQGIRLVKYLELDPAKRDTLRQEFITNIFPLLTPLALDPGAPVPADFQPGPEPAGDVTPSRRQRRPHRPGQGAGRQRHGSTLPARRRRERVCGPRRYHYQQP